jgi:hypothetical protein
LPPFAAVPPAQMLNAGQDFDQLIPPSCDTSATRPWDPPSDQRSCWWKPTRFELSVGFTSNQGSISVSGKLTPGTSSAVWNPSPGPPQPGANGVPAALASVGSVVE